MQTFQWVQGALGVITGLAMTRIVVSASHMFIGRRSVRLDWVPFVWATSVFFFLLQFSWGFVALNGRVERWTFAIFIMLLIFVLNLFAAAALVLPNTESQAGGDLRVWHEEHGRWALPFIAAYVLLAYPFNWFFMRSSPLDNPASAFFAILAAVAFWAPSRKVLVGATIGQLLGASALVFEMIVEG